jgi:hypothetical protein
MEETWAEVGVSPSWFVIPISLTIEAVPLISCIVSFSCSSIAEALGFIFLFLALSNSVQANSTKALSLLIVLSLRSSWSLRRTVSLSF